MEPPIKSASIILQKSDGTVYLSKRGPSLNFFPTFWVFPGGKIDFKLPENWNGDEPEVYQTVFQELFEEAGIIPGVPYTIPSENRRGDYLDFDYDKEKRLEFKASMIYLGKKQTPPFRIKTYNAAYFLVKGEIVDGLDPKADGTEMTDQMWILPKEAIEKWENGELKIPPPILHLLRTMACTPDKVQIKTLVETELPVGLQTKIEFAPGFEVIPFTSNTIPPFFNTNMIKITSEDEYLIIDPGASDSAKDHLIEILRTIPKTPKVLITHDHSDHWYGLKFVEEIFPDAVIYAHPNTLKRLTTNLNKKAIISGELEVGSYKLQILYTPGHTDSSISIFHQKTKVLITGDHVVGYGSAVLDSKSGDMKQYFDSCEKLKSLDARILIPAHGPPNYNPNKLLQQYIDHRLERENAILNAINNQANNLNSIIEVVYTDVPKEMWEIAKNNVILHLRKLRDENKLDETKYDEIIN